MTTSDLVFLHFNDVYHISKQDKIARFLTQLNVYRKKYARHSPYTIFAGDVFSPSLEASILRGAHMLPLLRELRIDLGCYGNHDFDFGEQRLAELVAETDFPWLLSNAIREPSATSACNGIESKDPDDSLLAGALKHHTVTLQGFKVGFFGLAGTDWPSNCRELPKCTIASPVETARACSRHLRRAAGCDFVVAVTHMQLAEDIQVSEALRNPRDPLERVDLILGGHDHELLRRYGGEASSRSKDPKVMDCNYPSDDDDLVDANGRVQEARGAVRIVKSGTDWSGLSCVGLRVDRTADGLAVLKSVTVEQTADIAKVPLDPSELSESRLRIARCLEVVNQRIDELGADPLVHTAVPLQGIGTVIRGQESNLGNMLADMVRAFYEVDIGLVNSGSVRCDRLIHATKGPGALSTTPLTVRDLIEILPFDNAIVVKRVTGEALLDALENSFSDAHTDGRFLHYSGLNVVVDWSRNEGSRVLEAWHCPRLNSRRRIRRGDDLSFTVAMVAFIGDGFDGYTCFQDQEKLVSEEGGITDTQLFLRTLGYGYDDRGSHHEVSVDEEDVRFKRAQHVIAREWDSSGLPVVAPLVEGRIVTRQGVRCGNL